MNYFYKIKHYFSEKRILSFILFLFIPAAVFYGMEFFLCNPFEKQRFPIQLLNIFLFELFSLFGLFLFKKGKYILRFLCLFFGLTGLVNYFVLSFRGTPFMPWDLFSVKTATAVADNYSYRIDGKTLLIIGLFFLLFLLSGLCDITVKSCKLRVSASIFAFCLLLGSCGYVQSNHALTAFRFYDKLFTPTTMTYRNGTIITLILQAKYLFVEKPEGYTTKQAKELLSSQEKEAEIITFSVHEGNNNSKEQSLRGETSHLPNIIVIMNEAFCDPFILGDFSVNEDPLPFVHSLLKGYEDSRSGVLNVSVLGGNTANSEFEFLTSHTMAFLPQGSIPYQQYLKKESFSLPSYLRSFGYDTVALHPYGASGWQRDQVYPLLGFNSFYSLEDFTAPKKIRNYISDEENYKMIQEIYENKTPGQPLFLFNVTMQNHSSYTESFDNFSPDIKVKGCDCIALSNYLSLLRISDKEIEKLVSYFSSTEEKTLLLFFGDHQPTDSVVKDIWLQNGKDPQNLSFSDRLLRYQVPFFLWANYDLLEEQNMETSINYLSLLLLEAAGIPFNEYYTFLAKQQKVFPVISALHAKDSSFISYELREIKDKLKDYSTLQYYLLFEQGLSQ